MFPSSAIFSVRRRPFTPTGTDTITSPPPSTGLSRDAANPLLGHSGKAASSPLAAPKPLQLLSGRLWPGAAGGGDEARGRADGDTGGTDPRRRMSRGAAARRDVRGMVRSIFHRTLRINGGLLSVYSTKVDGTLGQDQGLIRTSSGGIDFWIDPESFGDRL